MTAFQLSMKPPMGLGVWFDSRFQSPEALALREALKRTTEGDSERDRRSVIFGQRYWALAEAYQEALEDNWDGYGALAASTEAYQSALLFLDLLPSSAPNPEVAIDPDGDVSFDWHLGPRANFSVSISATGWLSYAGLYGRNSNYGTESITDGLPRAVLDNLGRLFNLVPKARTG